MILLDRKIPIVWIDVIPAFQCLHCVRSSRLASRSIQFGKGANREVSDGKADLWPRSAFFLGESQQGAARKGKIPGAFSEMTRALDGWV